MMCALETTKPATIKPFLRECGDKHFYEVPPYTMEEFREVMQHYKKVQYISIDDSTLPLLLERHMGVQPNFYPSHYADTKATENFIYQMCSGLPGPVFKYCAMQ